MPIVDHFKGEVSKTRSWSSFHYLWAGLIAGELNRILPEDFVAEPNVYRGAVEVDVKVDEFTNQESEGTKVIYQTPVPSTVINVANLKVGEVRIFDLNHARKTVGVIEIASPASKDSGQHQHAFLAKCYSFIAHGVSLVIVDIVTTRSFSFHNALIQKFQSRQGQIKRDDNRKLYCSAYRYVSDEENPTTEIWAYPLQVGDFLPDMPLFISQKVAVPVKLEQAYMRTCQELKINQEVMEQGLKNLNYE